MKYLSGGNTFGGGWEKILLLFLLLSVSHETLASRALDNANTTTNTDTNNDGKSDGNVETIFKDNDVKNNQAIKISSHNVRGSLQDAKCIAGTGEACSDKPYFMAGNLGTQIDALTGSFQNSIANINNNAFRSNSGSNSNALLNAANGTCSNVPSAFGCNSGDYSLLKEAREAIDYSIKKGDYANGGLDILSKVDKFISDFNNVRDVVAKGFSGGLDLFGMNSLPGGSGVDPDVFVDGRDKSGGPKFSYEDYARGDFDRNQVATKGVQNWVGPASLDQMSAAIEVYNGLEAFDARSGKLLTLWQRATRRYQAFDLSRAYTLAKTEGARGQIASSKRAPASANLTK